jgi:hypothetical protein
LRLCDPGVDEQLGDHDLVRFAGVLGDFSESVLSSKMEVSVDTLLSISFVTSVGGFLRLYGLEIEGLIGTTAEIRNTSSPQ